MDDPVRVGVEERVAKGDTEPHDVAVAQRAGGLELGQRGALDEL